MPPSPPGAIPTKTRYPPPPPPLCAFLTGGFGTWAWRSIVDIFCPKSTQSTDCRLSAQCRREVTIFGKGHFPKKPKNGPLRLQDLDTTAATLITRWSPCHAPISPLKLRQATLKAMHTAKEKPSPADTDTPPDPHSAKVVHKLQKPISQFLPARLRLTWGRLKFCKVVAILWALPNEVHGALQTIKIPNDELVPFEFGRLAWVVPVCLTWQPTSPPVSDPTPLTNKGVWTPAQPHTLLECSVLSGRSMEVLHQIE